MAASMRAARLHEPGQPLRIDTVEIPEPRSRDVLVQVKASGVIPNMNAIFSGRLWNHLPPLPASVGLDAAGVVVKVGSEVTDVAVGDRVYVNPWLSCGMCSYCRAGEPMLCEAAAFQGYFGFFPHSIRQLMAYPFGGFSEYMTASPQRLVLLPQQVTFDQAARFGYLGTSFAALRLGQVGGGSWIAINGITGTLGVGATLLALGMGATRILGVGRNRDVLARLKALAPDRIEVLTLGDASIAEWGATAHRSTGRGRARRLLRPQRCGCQHGGGTRCAEARCRRRQYRRFDGAARNPTNPLHDRSPAISGFELVHDGGGPADG